VATLAFQSPVRARDRKNHDIEYKSCQKCPPAEHVHSSAHKTMANAYLFPLLRLSREQRGIRSSLQRTGELAARRHAARKVAKRLANASEDTGSASPSVGSEKGAAGSLPPEGTRISASHSSARTAKWQAAVIGEPCDRKRPVQRAQVATRRGRIRVARGSSKGLHQVALKGNKPARRKAASPSTVAVPSAGVA